MASFTNVHVEGVEFFHMGQQILGSYPIHVLFGATLFSFL